MSTINPETRLSYNVANEAWDECVSLLGPERVLNEIRQMFDTDVISYIIENLNSDYDLELSCYED